MAFGAATVVTTVGKTTFANRLQTTPTLNPVKYIGVGNGATTGAHTAVVGDTVLQAERQTPRSAGTETLPGATNIYQVQGTWTASANYNTPGGANAPIDEAGLFDATTAGNMGATATFNIISLSNGDSIQFTWQITIS